MSLNTAHTNDGVLIHMGEQIFLFCDDVTMEFHHVEQEVFRGSKRGRLYLTTHRMIFTNKNASDKLMSFSFPFVSISEVELEQPVFGANYIKGKVRAQPNGNWVGEAKFKLMFKSGGCIEFGQVLLKAAQMAMRMGPPDYAPPPYVPPTGPWYAAPAPAYAPNPTGYYGWVPPTDAFPHAPAANSVFMTDMPPPYPGINGYNGYATAPSAPGAAGFTMPQNTSSQDAKAAEAAQSAYYDPNKPQCAYVPPPSYYEPPPSYHHATNKKDQ